MDKKNIRILVSACLLGVNCRYDGKNGRRDEVLELLKEYELIPVCPEQMGGLGTPREPAECRAGPRDEPEGLRCHGIFRKRRGGSPSDREAVWLPVRHFKGTQPLLRQRGDLRRHLFRRKDCRRRGDGAAS